VAVVVDTTGGLGDGVVVPVVVGTDGVDTAGFGVSHAVSARSSSRVASSTSRDRSKIRMCNMAGMIRPNVRVGSRMIFRRR
jgi:hypothetical protein